MASFFEACCCRGPDIDDPKQPNVGEMPGVRIEEEVGIPMSPALLIQEPLMTERRECDVLTRAAVQGGEEEREEAGELLTCAPTQGREEEKELREESEEQEIGRLKTERFAIVLSKANRNERWGFFVDSMQSSCVLLVTEVLDSGVLHEYNRTAPEEKQLLKNDFILSVDGMTDSAYMLDTLMVRDAVSLEVARPQQETKTIARAWRSVGFSWSYSSKTARAIYVKEVDDKEVKLLVSKHDVIIGAGGKLGTVKDMLKQLRHGSSVELQLLHIDF